MVAAFRFEGHTDAQRLQQANQAAQPDAAAARHDGVAKYRNNQRAGLHPALLAKIFESLLDGGKLGGHCGSIWEGWGGRAKREFTRSGGLGVKCESGLR